MARTAGDASKRFDQLEKTTSDLARALQDLTGKVSGLEKSFGGAVKKTKELDKAVRGGTTGVSHLRNQVDKMPPSVDDATASFGKFQRILSIVRSRLLIVSFATRMVTQSIGRLVKLTAEQQKVERKLELQLGKTARSLIKYAAAQERATRFGDELTISAMTQIAAYTKNEDQIKRIIKAAMDLSVLMDKGLNETTLLLTKTIFSSTDALSRYGITIEGAAGSTKKFENAMKKAEEMAGGLSESEEELAQALTDIDNAIGTLGESLGTVFVPLVIAASKAMLGISSFFDENRVKSYTAALLSAATTYGLYAVATGKAAKAMLLFNKISTKNLIIFGAMVIVSEIIDKFNMFGDSSDGSAKALANLNFTMEATIDQSNELSLSKAKLIALESGLSDTMVKQNQLSVRRNQNLQLEADTVEILTKKAIELNKIDVEQIMLNREIHAEKMQQYSEILGALSQISGAFSDIAMAGIERDRQNELSTANDIKNEKRRKAEIGRINDEFDAKARKKKKELMTLMVFEAAANASMALLNVWADKDPGGFWARVAKSAAVTAIAGAQIAQIQANVAKFALGGDFITSGPQNIMVGDNPGGRERVQVTPLSSPNIAGPQGGTPVVVNVSGNVLTQDFVEGELAENIKEAIRRGTDFGIS